MRGAPSLRSYALRPTSQSPVAARITSVLAIASLAGAMLIPPDMGGGTVRRYHGRRGPRTCVLAQLAQTTSSALPIQSNTRLCQDVREQEALRQGRGQSDPTVKSDRGWTLNEIPSTRLAFYLPSIPFRGLGLIAATATSASLYAGRRQCGGWRHGLLPAPRRLRRPAALLRVPAGGVPCRERHHSATGGASCAAREDGALCCCSTPAYPRASRCSASRVGCTGARPSSCSTPSARVASGAPSDAGHCRGR